MSFTITEAHMRSHHKQSSSPNAPSAIPAAKPADAIGPNRRDPGFRDPGPRGLVIGLKILEYLASCQAPATLSTLAEALNISVASASRSILILEQRGYVAQTADNGAYERTTKLYHIKTTPLPYQRLLGHAQPVMRALSDSISQSCNLAIPSSPDMLVVAQSDSPGAFWINVPVGFRYDIPASAPGLAFAAFMRNSDPARWPHGLSAVVDAHQWTSLKSAVQKATESGFAQVTNPHLPDVIDLSCPVFDDGHFVAALTIPYIQTRSSPNLTWCLAALQQAAEQLNESLHSDALVA